jgi:RNA-binding protein YhbY
MTEKIKNRFGEIINFKNNDKSGYKYFKNSSYNSSPKNKKYYNRHLQGLEHIDLKNYNELINLPISFESIYQNKINFTVFQVVIMMNMAGLDKEIINYIDEVLQQHKIIPIATTNNNISLYCWKDIYNVVNNIEKLFIGF